jgi:ATP-dependent DNA helicase RecG
MSFSDAELEQLIDDHESDRIEFKESWKGDAPQKGREAICAFANDIANNNCPGILFVGMKDNRTPSNLLITDELLTTLADIRTDGQILPIPSITVQKKTLKGAEVAMVMVEPSDSPPVRYKGKIWVRTGSRRVIASPQDERILNEKRRSKDILFELQPIPSSTIDDLNRRLFEEEYLIHAMDREVLEQNRRTFEERLAACKMVTSDEDPIPTILGHLVIGKRTTDWIPGAYIQFLRIDGGNLSDPVIDEMNLSGPLSEVLRRMEDKLESHNRVHVDFTSQSTETRLSPYPRVALQQIVRNAVMHRTYEHTHSPVRIHWFTDRIEILNPGGPYGIVNAENFGRPGITDYRNPNLADAMKVLGFVQRFGAGIQLANAAMEKNGNPKPEFIMDQNTTLCILRQPL